MSVDLGQLQRDEHTAWESEMCSASARCPRWPEGGFWALVMACRAQGLVRRRHWGSFQPRPLLRSLQPGRSHLHAFASTVCWVAVPRRGHIPDIGDAGHPASLTRPLTGTAGSGVVQTDVRVKGSASSCLLTQGPRGSQSS